MAQTSVEWLIDELNKKQNGEGSKLSYNHMFDKAKEMERKEHGKTWDAALDKYEVRAGNYMRAYEDFDDYYNETFKNI